MSTDDTSAKTSNQLSELLLDYAWRSLDRTTDYFVRTEGKGSVQGTYLGVTLTVALAGMTTVFPQGKWEIGFGCAAQLFYLSSIIANALGLLACYRALWLRSTLDLPRVVDVKHYLKDMEALSHTPKAFIDEVTDYISKTQTSFTDAAHAKQKNIRTTGKFAIAGIVLLLLAGASALVHTTLMLYVKTAH